MSIASGCNWGVSPAHWSCSDLRFLHGFCKEISTDSKTHIQIPSTLLYLALNGRWQSFFIPLSLSPSLSPSLSLSRSLSLALALALALSLSLCLVLSVSPYASPDWPEPPDCESRAEAQCRVCRFRPLWLGGALAQEPKAFHMPGHLCSL